MEAGNPYQSPAGPTSFPQPIEFQGDPLSKLKAPAIILMVFAVISLAMVGLSMFMQAVAGELDFDIDNPESMGELTGMLLPSVGDLIVLISSFYMLKGTRFTTCRIGVIVACVPCCSPCFVFGIPFGIWALIVLHQPDVRAAFKE